MGPNSSRVYGQQKFVSNVLNELYQLFWHDICSHFDLNLFYKSSSPYPKQRTTEDDEFT